MGVFPRSHMLLLNFSYLFLSPFLLLSTSTEPELAHMYAESRHIYPFRGLTGLFWWNGKRFRLSQVLCWSLLWQRCHWQADLTRAARSPGGNISGICEISAPYCLNIGKAQAPKCLSSSRSFEQNRWRLVLLKCQGERLDSDQSHCPRSKTCKLS